MILSKEAFLSAIKEKIGDDTSDESIAFLENMTDTVSDYESRLSDTTDWKQKYEENDKQWRQKYMDRFNTPIKQESEPIIEPEGETLDFNNLFKEE